MKESYSLKISKISIFRAGMMIGAGKGVIRTIYCDQKSYGDFLPVDVAINGLMVCTWNYIAFRFVNDRYFLKFDFLIHIFFRSDKEHYIVNFTSSQDIALPWESILDMGQDIISKKYPLNQIMWYPGGGMSKYRTVHRVKSLLFHWLPALFIDTLLFCLGFKPILWRVHERIAKGMEVLEYYANNQWDFDNKHAIIIRARMNETELKKYKVDAKGIDIYKYFEHCILGARRYLLKQTDDMLPSARRMMTVMYIIDKLCKTVIYGGLLYWLAKRLLPLFFTRDALNDFYSSIFNTLS
jgi:fatty acyl-CoA reductase